MKVLIIIHYKTLGELLSRGFSNKGLQKALIISYYKSVDNPLLKDLFDNF
jgi:hypothetical protein